MRADLYLQTACPPGPASGGARMDRGLFYREAGRRAGVWPPLACPVPVCRGFRGFRAASLTRCLCLVRLGRPPSSAVSSRVSQQGWGSLTLLSGFQAVTLGCFSAFPAGSSARPRQQEGSGQRRPLEDLCMGAAPVGRLGLRSPGRGTECRDESLRAELGNLRAGAINHTATVS